MNPNETGYKVLTSAVEWFVIFMVNNPISMDWVAAMDANNPADILHPNFAN